MFLYLCCAAKRIVIRLHLFVFFHWVSNRFMIIRKPGLA
nr:MAG TPA_asm: hypothetical protein [Caudoviricetes sp.]